MHVVNPRQQIAKNNNLKEIDIIVEYPDTEYDFNNDTNHVFVLSV